MNSRGWLETTEWLSAELRTSSTTDLTESPSSGSTPWLASSNLSSRIWTSKRRRSKRHKRKKRAQWISKTGFGSRSTASSIPWPKSTISCRRDWSKERQSSTPWRGYSSRSSACLNPTSRRSVITSSPIKTNRRSRTSRRLKAKIFWKSISMTPMGQGNKMIKP